MHAKTSSLYQVKTTLGHRLVGLFTANKMPEFWVKNWSLSDIFHPLTPTSASPQLNHPIRRKLDAQQKPCPHPPPPPPFLLAQLRTLAVQCGTVQQIPRPTRNQTLSPPLYRWRPRQRLKVSPGNKNALPSPQTPSLLHQVRRRTLRLLLHQVSSLKLSPWRLSPQTNLSLTTQPQKTPPSLLQGNRTVVQRRKNRRDPERRGEKEMWRKEKLNLLGRPSQGKNWGKRENCLIVSWFNSTSLCWENVGENVFVQERFLEDPNKTNKFLIAGVDKNLLKKMTRPALCNPR